MDLWPNYAFTPDGKSIVFSNHGKLVRLDLASGGVRDIPFTAPVERRDRAAGGVAGEGRVRTGAGAHPAMAQPVCRTAASIAFEAFGRVWLQELDGGKAVGFARRLTQSRRVSAAARVRGRRFRRTASGSPTSPGPTRRAARLEGRGRPGATPVKLTRTAGHYANPAWSPTGDRLALIRGSGLEFRGQQPEEEEFFEVSLLDARGGEPQPVRRSKLANALRFHPQVLLERRRHAALLPRADRGEEADGRSQERPRVGPARRHRPPRPTCASPRSTISCPSPDGQWVVFTSRDNVYVTALPGDPDEGTARGQLQGGARSRSGGSPTRPAVTSGWTDGGPHDHLGAAEHVPPAAAGRGDRLRRGGAAPQGARRRKKKEAAAKDAPATEQQKEDKEKEKVQDGAGSQGGDDRDRADGAARRARGLVRSSAARASSR